MRMILFASFLIENQRSSCKNQFPLKSKFMNLLNMKSYYFFCRRGQLNYRDVEAITYFSADQRKKTLITDKIWIARIQYNPVSEEE